ncbi:OmpA family protein [Sphingomonas arenae]|uniref:OmpA family protein n=1 Tax=Sphingomonas arenae TaxID=2812555 RepID=UPI0019674E8A|nr:OmpA family protein [Sphingomonas arenae]
MSLLLAALIAQAPPIAPGSCAGGLIAVAAGEPCPTLLFFDSSKAAITRDSAAALEQVISGWKTGAFRRVILSGHADLSGPSSANLRASRLRSMAVGDWLSSHGIPSTAITVQALGESRPLIPTADGVREPQNRRVEIRLMR